MQEDKNEETDLNQETTRTFNNERTDLVDAFEHSFYFKEEESEE